ncbi:MAG: hypothetical protein DSZ03_05365 [Sulfurimonas sp.]|nr:MAG: hypothetical protein DSZ03_05365 [Sulfurimonas sp.]
MTKLIIITLLSTLSLLATMQMQTIQTKKIVVGTFSTADALERAKKTVSQIRALRPIGQDNNVLMTTRTNGGNTTLILEHFKTIREALNAFVAVSKHYPKAYLIDDSYRVAVDVPAASPQPSQYVPPAPAVTRTPEPAMIPTISEADVMAAASEALTPETAPKPPIEEAKATAAKETREKEKEPVVIVVTEAGSEAERLAIEKALEQNDTPQEQTPPETREEEVVITEIEELPLDEPDETQHASTVETAISTAGNSTISEAAVVDEERYKRKSQQDETAFLSTSTLIYILLTVIALLLVLLWRRSKEVDVHQLLGDQHKH